MSSHHLRPRNPIAQQAFARKGGVHGKTRKAERRNDKVRLRRKPGDEPP